MLPNMPCYSQISHSLVTQVRIGNRLEGGAELIEGGVRAAGGGGGVGEGMVEGWWGGNICCLGRKWGTWVDSFGGEGSTNP